MADHLVMEEREELMVSPGGGNVRLRKAHFLKPSAASIDDSVAAPSLDCFSSSTGYKDLPFTVNYHGWKQKPYKKWKIWADQMHSLHHSTWKRVGILDSIMSSTCTIHRNDDLVFGFVEKWCPKTNSFVFRWGEATITLEDVMVLGGYSVLGESVSIPHGDGEMEETVKKLVDAHSNISRSKVKKAAHDKWITQFMGNGSEIEHEAFLAYWLSRFVFPFTRDSIGKSVLSIAVHLSRGTKIALAPAVLACIYKSLTLLKAGVIAARKYGTKEGRNVYLEVTVPAPLALVQVWVWERFPSLRPEPRSIGQNEPRLARWHDLKLGKDYRSLTIDSDGKDFQWRPYTTAESNVVLGVIYKDNERWVRVDSDLDEDLKGYVRCLRTSELVSLEGKYIEHYLPHRVAMQFGMDQDLPGHVTRVNVSPEIAWSDYTRPIRDVKLYVPSHLYEPCVSTRYLKWWEQLNVGWSDTVDPGTDGKIYEHSILEVEKDLFGRKSEDDFFPQPPGFSLKWKRAPKASGTTKQPHDAKNDILVRRKFGHDSGGKGGSKKSKRKLVESSSFSLKRKRSRKAGASGNLEQPHDAKNDNLVPQKVDGSRSRSQSRLYSAASNGGSGGKGSSKSSKRKLVESSSRERLDYNDMVHTTGFAPKHSPLKASHSSSGIEEKVAQPSGTGSYGDNQSQDNAQGESTANNENNQEVRSMVEPVESEVECMPRKEAPIDGLDKKIGTSPNQVQSSTLEPPGIRLEERVRNIEKLLAFIKTGKLVHLDENPK